jgi:hypothetical protein
VLNSILLVPKSETPQFLCKIALNIHIFKFKNYANRHYSMKTHHSKMRYSVPGSRALCKFTFKIPPKLLLVYSFSKYREYQENSYVILGMVENAGMGTGYGYRVPGTG